MAREDNEAVTPDATAPVGQRERIASLDVLRGFALLGIIVMNIQSFGMPGAAYINPTAYGDFTGLNKAAWAFGQLIVDTKFISLFSMLFGAGIVLFAERLRERGRAPGRLHYRRMLWLLLFGTLHAFLLWYGDILMVYAMVAFILYPLHRARPKRLAISGVVLYAIGILVAFGLAAAYPSLPPEGQAEFQTAWAPDQATVDEEIAAYQGGWSAQMEHRGPEAFLFHIPFFFVFWIWHVGGLMLIGMALYKWGVLSAKRDDRTYGRMAGFGLGVGYSLVLVGILLNEANGWTFESSFFYGSTLNQIGAPMVTLGYVGVLCLAVRAGRAPRVRTALANVGRTAFSNYILQTVLMTTLFYGHGFGWFGQVERLGLLAIAFTVMAVNLALSAWWLRRFRMGPLEWAWRSLTYWRFQAISAKRPAAA